MIVMITQGDVAMLQPNPLNSLNTMELLSKIEEFKRLDLKTASINDITMKVCQTLSCMIVTSSVFKEGTRLYRVRSLKSDLSNMPKIFQDIWLPPVEKVKADGRVNLQGQPVLYTSTEQITPLYECNIADGDYYAIIQYSVKPGQELIGYCVGNGVEPDDLNETGKINNKIINDFLVSEFSKPVGKGTEYLYKLSNVICQSFMDMPFCDAYVYPSVAHYKKGWNVAIKPNSANCKIAFDCVLICRSGGFDSSGNHVFQVLHKANLDTDNNLVYRF